MHDNRLTSWLFEPETQRIDPCRSLFVFWAEKRRRPEKWVVDKVAKSYKWAEQSVVSISNWFRISFLSNRSKLPEDQYQDIEL
jgi:hypothetical protein